MNAPHPIRALDGHLATIAPSLDSLPPVTPSRLDGEVLARHVADFLHAVDRGDYGRALEICGVESAYLTGLRIGLAEHRADAALVRAAHRRGQSIAAELHDGVRP